MREGCEKGTFERRDRRGRARGKDAERETEERRASTRCRSRRTRAKRLARRDFSNFLCVLSSFPGYLDENVGRLSVLLRVAL